MSAVDHRAAIAAMGRELSPGMLEAVQAVYTRRATSTGATLAGNRKRLRLRVPRAASAGRLCPADARSAPVLVWVHGGGFTRGDKGDATTWPNAHAGRMAAAAGMVGVTINYRLAPGHGWPAGGEDVLAAVGWCRANIARFGGDPQRIVVAGTSAGAAHVATALSLDPAPAGLCGAVLLSGLYGVTPYDDPRDLAYFGDDTARMTNAGRSRRCWKARCHCCSLRPSSIRRGSRRSSPVCSRHGSPGTDNAARMDRHRP